MICLETNKICSEQNRKCKECKLNDCREAINMIETQEENEDKWKRKLIDIQLPERL